MSTQTRSKSRSRAAQRTRPHASRPARRTAKSPARRRAAHRARASHGTAAHELELFVALLKKCKRAVAGFSDEQKQHLRAVMAKAHRAIDKLHS